MTAPSTTTTTPAVGRGAVALLGCAGASLVCAQALLPPIPSTASGQVTAVLAHRSAVTVSGAAFLLGAVLLVLGVNRLGRLVGLRSRRLVAAGLSTMAVGALWPAVGRAMFNLVLVAIAANTPRPAAISAVHAIGSSAALSITLPILLAFAVGPILLGIGLWRSGLGAPWSVGPWLAGVIVVNASAASSRPGATFGMAIAACGLVLLAQQATRALIASPAAESASVSSSATATDRVQHAMP